jgi:membrane-bound serine protease (ClpP class)
MEAFTPTFGILLGGGAVSFFLGALMLFQDLPEEMQISWYWLVPATILTVLVFALIMSAGIKAQFTKHVAGLESMQGERAEVIDTIEPDNPGRVQFSGEYWKAESDEPIETGENCEIIEFKGLTVKVKPITPKKETNNE